MKSWRFVGAGLDGGSFVIDGVDVWQHEWERVAGAVAVVTDPEYGQEFKFAVYRASDGTRGVEFAAGEFSNCFWGFYVADSAAEPE